MDNEQLQQQIQNLIQTVKKLLASYKKHQETIQQLQQENAQLKQQHSHKKQKNNFLHDFQVSTTTQETTNANTFRNSLDSYIKDINSSIAYLEQLQ